MRLFAGILYSGENEYDACVESVESQDYDDFEYFVFSGLGKKEAHDTMFQAFMDSGFDLLVHIGADMVLLHPWLFSNIVGAFKDNDFMQHLEIPVQDFFSDQPIWGLNTYCNIHWRKSDEQVFTDFVEVERGRKRAGCGILSPAVAHCPDPGLFQAFHGGAHKGMKILEANRRCMGDKVAYYQDIVRKTHESYMDNGDVRRAVFITGARFAVSRGLKSEHLDYTNPYLKKEFQKLQGKGELVCHR